MDDCMTVTILEPDHSDNYHSYTNGLSFIFKGGARHLKEKNNQFLKRRASQGRQKKDKSFLVSDRGKKSIVVFFFCFYFPLPDLIDMSVNHFTFRKECIRMWFLSV